MRYTNSVRGISSSVVHGPPTAPFYSPQPENVPISNQQSVGYSPDVSIQFLLTFRMILANLKRNRVPGKRPVAPSNIRGVQKRFSCDFENGWCPGWTRNISKELDWEIHSGSTYNPYTGPDVDHTLRTSDGHYAYFNGSIGYFGQQASFYTPHVSMEDSLRYCLSFWYHMRGRGVGTLKVFWKFPATRANRTGFEYLVFSKKRPSSLTELDWKSVKITLYSPLAFIYTSPVYFEFRASKGILRSSDVALDDVSLVPGPCDPRNVHRPTGPPSASGPETIYPFFSGENVTESDRFITSTPSRNQRCGLVLYNSLTHTCCNGTIREGKGVCCGKWVMVHPDQACCDEKVAYYPGDQQCCNGIIYFRRFHQCCNGKLKLRILNCDL